MTPRDEDLDWLYRKPPARPEPTSVPHPDEPDRLRHQQHGTGRPADQGYPRPDWSATPTPPPPQERPRKKHGGRRRRRRPVLRTFGILLLAWVLFLIGTPVYAWSIGTRVDAFPDGGRPGQQPGTTVLLVGSDAREDLSAEDRSRLGTGSTEGRRTDTMMLMHLPVVGEPVLLSLPRDSYVEIPGHGTNKLNAAYAFGGAPLLVETIEADTGIRIDGYLEIGFLGVVDVVDALGGIEVCPAFDFDDRDSHLKMSAGCQQVDGVTALSYVRMRKADPRGDLGRMERQREVIAAIVSELASPVTFLNPVRYWRLNMAAAHSLSRGEGTGLSEVGRVAVGFVSAMSGRGLSMTVPVADANARRGGKSVVLWDDDAASAVFGAIASGDTTGLEKYRR